jgi:hypothetical protein
MPEPKIMDYILTRDFEVAAVITEPEERQYSRFDEEIARCALMEPLPEGSQPEMHNFDGLLFSPDAQMLSLLETLRTDAR